MRRLAIVGGLLVVGAGVAFAQAPGTMPPAAGMSWTEGLIGAAAVLSSTGAALGTMYQLFLKPKIKALMEPVEKRTAALESFNALKFGEEGAQLLRKLSDLIDHDLPRRLAELEGAAGTDRESVRVATDRISSQLEEAIRLLGAPDV